MTEGAKEEAGDRDTSHSKTKTKIHITFQRVKLAIYVKLDNRVVTHGFYLHYVIIQDLVCIYVHQTDNKSI